MDIIEAHGRFAVRKDRTVFGFYATLSLDGQEVDGWPAACTALANLSGQLDDCETEEHLSDAVDHGLSLLSIGVVTDEELEAEVRSVVREIIDWGDRNCGECAA